MISKDYIVVLHKATRRKIVASSVDSGALMYAEIEFDTVTDSLEFDSKSISMLGDEVTYSDMYYMKNYWNSTRLGGKASEEA